MNVSTPFKNVNRNVVTSYLDSYFRGEIDRKLTVPQVLYLKWHNARMIHHVTAMKSITCERISLKPQARRGWSDSNCYALEAEKTYSIANLDRLLGLILEDNVKLAKRLHDHATPGPMTQSASKIESSSLKRSASEQSYGDSSSDCTSNNKRVAHGWVVQVWSNAKMTSIEDSNRSSCVGEKRALARHHAAETVCGGREFPNLPKVEVASPSIQLMPPKVDDLSFHTPSNLKQNVAVSPAISAMHTSEAGLLYRIMEAEDSFNLNARSLENEFTDSPIEKITVKQGKIAKDPWEHGVKIMRRTDELAQNFMVWLLYNETEELDRIWIMHTQPRHLEIHGHALKNIIIKGLPFTYELFDLFARRLAHLDRWMYGPGTLLCFRHIFESDFVMMVLANEDPLAFRSIREQIMATAQYYDMSECRMLSVPALVSQTWCAYFWDMELHCVHIIDPTFHWSRHEELKVLHDYNVSKIQKALSTCISAMFSCWNIEFGDWPNNYVKPIIAGASSRDSGILTLLAIRDFNGARFVMDHDEASVEKIQGLGAV